MTVRGSKSGPLVHIERALDDNEQYIGNEVWRQLEKAFEKADDETEELEKELKEAQERIEELEAKIAELEAER